jgi:transposase
MAIPLQSKHSSNELKVLLRKNKDELMKTRIKILLLIKKDFSRKEVSERLSVNIDTITDVIKRYNKNGIDSLKTNKGGRPLGNPLWDSKIFDKLIEEIDKQDKYWSVPIMQEWINKHFKKDIPEQTVWYRMNIMNNFSYKSNRPHPYKGDKDKQDIFKKKGYRILSKTQ